MATGERSKRSEKARDAVLVVVADDGRGGGLDRVPGIVRRVGLVGAFEHGQVVLAVTEADDPGRAELLPQYVHRPALAGVAVVYIDPAIGGAFQRGAGIGHQTRLGQHHRFHRFDGGGSAQGADIGDLRLGRNLPRR